MNNGFVESLSQIFTIHSRRWTLIVYFLVWLVITVIFLIIPRPSSKAAAFCPPQFSLHFSHQLGDLISDHLRRRWWKYSGWTCSIGCCTPVCCAPGYRIIVLEKYIWVSTGLLCPTYWICVEIFWRVLGGAKVDHSLISPHLIICTTLYLEKVK